MATSELLGIFALARQLTRWGVEMSAMMHRNGMLTDADMRRIRAAADISDRDFDNAVREAAARLGRPLAPPATDMESDVDDGAKP